MEIVLLCARWFVAAVFIVAGVGKLLDRPGSERSLVDFGVSLRLAGWAALALPAAELAVAAALLIGDSARWGAVASLLLLGAFIAGVIRALTRGVTPDCHCFGQLHSAPAGQSTILRNLVLAVPATVVAVGGPGDALTGLDSAQSVLIGLGALAFALAIAVIILVRVNQVLRRMIAPEPLQVGTQAPDLRLETEAGEDIRLVDILADDRPTVLVFVAPECGPCQALMPQLARWQRSLAERLELVVISSSDEPIVGSEVPVTVRDPRAAAPVAYRVLGTPAAVLADSAGQIASAPATGSVTIEALIRVGLERSEAPVAVAAG